MIKQQLTKIEIEAARGEIFHMILFAMAWVIFGEYAVNFNDHLAAAGLLTVAVALLALYCVSLYSLQAELQESKSGVAAIDKRQYRMATRFSVLYILEGFAIMASCVILIHSEHEKGLIPSLALLAGLHFFPLAKIFHLNGYHLLGAWITVCAVTGYWLVSSGRMTQTCGEALVAYGCAGGALIYAAWIAVRTEKRVI